MTWPTGPPPMPPSGWYDDVEQPFTWRYWDGASWTEYRSPKWTPPVRDPRSFSVWFERSLDCIKVVVRRVGLLLLALWAVTALVALCAGAVLVTSADGRELRDLLDFDSGFGTTNTLTDAQADRAGDLLGDLLVAAIPWIILVALVYAVVSAWSWAIVARVAAHHVTSNHVTANHVAETGPDAGRVEDIHAESTAQIAAASLRRLPAVIGSSLMFGLVFVGLVIVATLPIALVAAIDIGTAAIVLTVLFVIVAALTLGFWLWGRLQLALAIAGIGGHGIGFRRSWELTDGRFWYVVGRVIVASLIAGALGQAVNLVTNFGFFLDLVVLVAISLALQTVATVTSTIVQMSAMVVVLDQVDGLDAVDHSNNDVLHG